MSAKHQELSGGSEHAQNLLAVLIISFNLRKLGEKIKQGKKEGRVGRKS